MRKFLASLFLFLPLASYGQTVFELKFEGEKAIDTVGGNALEMHDVAVFRSGDHEYGDLNGKSAIVVPAELALTFARQDVLWLELWINPIKVAEDAVVVTKGTGGNYKLILQKSGKVAFSYYAAGSWRSLLSEEPLEMGSWQHVGIYFDASLGEAVLLLNGRVIAAAKELPPFQSQDDKPLYLGGAPKLAGDGFKGMLGGLSSVILARGNPRQVSSSLAAGEVAYEVQSPH